LLQVLLSASPENRKTLTTVCIIKANHLVPS
jgi:hypothetical protein